VEAPGYGWERLVLLKHLLDAQDKEFLPPNARGVIIDPRYAWVYDKKNSYYKKRNGAGYTHP
jgi:hypothetical protein